MRDLILDTLPINFEGRMERKERNEEEKKHSNRRDLNPPPLKFVHRRHVLNRRVTTAALYRTHIMVPL